MEFLRASCPHDWLLTWQRDLSRNSPEPLWMNLQCALVHRIIISIIAPASPFIASPFISRLFSALSPFCDSHIVSLFRPSIHLCICQLFHGHYGVMICFLRRAHNKLHCGMANDQWPRTSGQGYLAVWRVANSSEWERQTDLWRKMTNGTWRKMDKNSSPRMTNSGKRVWKGSAWKSRSNLCLDSHWLSEENQALCFFSEFRAFYPVPLSLVGIFVLYRFPLRLPPPLPLLSAARTAIKRLSELSTARFLDGACIDKEIGWK